MIQPDPTIYKDMNQLKMIERQRQMNPDRNDRIRIQIVLKNLGLYQGEIDGLIGKESIRALNKYHPTIANRSVDQKMALFVQMEANRKGLLPGDQVDGYFGPVTDEALLQLSNLVIMKKHIRITRPDIIVSDVQILNTIESKGWPKYGSEDFLMEFGEPGEQIIEIDAPYPMVYAFNNDIKIKKIKCNKAISESLANVLTSIYDEIGLENIKLLNLDQYGGCYVNRNMKGGTKKSTHAWGIAIDLDPANNRFRWDHTKALFARDEYELFHKIFEKAGWINLGRTSDFDWMHFQACRL